MDPRASAAWATSTSVVKPPLPLGGDDDDDDVRDAGPAAAAAATAGTPPPVADGAEDAAGGGEAHVAIGDYHPKALPGFQDVEDMADEDEDEKTSTSPPPSVLQSAFVTQRPGFQRQKRRRGVAWSPVLHRVLMVGENPHKTRDRMEWWNDAPGQRRDVAAADADNQGDRMEVNANGSRYRIIRWDQLPPARMGAVATWPEHVLRLRKTHPNNVAPVSTPRPELVEVTLQRVIVGPHEAQFRRLPAPEEVLQIPVVRADTP